MNTMEETRKFLESIGQPGGDLYQLPDSDKRFDDGCQYRFEVPGIQSPGVMKALLEEALTQPVILWDEARKSEVQRSMKTGKARPEAL